MSQDHATPPTNALHIVDQLGATPDLWTFTTGKGEAVTVFTDAIVLASQPINVAAIAIARAREGEVGDDHVGNAAAMLRTVGRLIDLERAALAERIVQQTETIETLQTKAKAQDTVMREAQETATKLAAWSSEARERLRNAREMIAPPEFAGPGLPNEADAEDRQVLAAATIATDRGELDAEQAGDFAEHHRRKFAVAQAEAYLALAKVFALSGQDGALLAVRARIELLLNRIESIAAACAATAP